jgi:hypothetical protein
MSIDRIFDRGRVPGLFLWAFVLCSCEKVVSVDLDQAESLLVVQGAVTDQLAPMVVVLTRTRDYFSSQSPQPMVSHAMVIVSDDLGRPDTLLETSAGTYMSGEVQGVPGRSYSLKVVVDGKEYSAVASMPPKVTIDSIHAEPIVEFNGRNGYDIDIVFRDPPQPGNFYRLEVHTKVWLEESFKWGQFILADDHLANGGALSCRFRASKNVHPGDTLTVALSSVDRSVYEYFRTVNDLIVSVENPAPSFPGNPLTNVTNGGLGYFAAYAIDIKSIVLQ